MSSSSNIVTTTAAAAAAAAEAKDNVDDSESLASDESEEIIEVDEDEFDRRRAICVSDMKDLEAQFMKLKEDLINEKQILIDQKLKEIEEETAEEFTVPIQKLKQNMEIKIKLATLLRDYRWKNIDHIYEYEIMSIKQSLESDKIAHYDKQMERIQSEIKQIEESRRQLMLDYSLYQLSKSNGCGAAMGDLYDDNEAEELDEYHNMDATSAPPPGSLDASGNIVEFASSNETKANSLMMSRTDTKSSTRSKTKSGKTKHHDSNVSPVLMPGAPFIVYSLHDYDILEDCSIIKMHNNLNENLV